MKKTTISLTPVSPYSFDLTAAYATYFQGQYGSASYIDGIFRQLLMLQDRRCLVSVRSAETTDSPELEVLIESPGLNESMVSEARRLAGLILGIDQNLSAFYRMALKDEALAPIVKDLFGLHIPQTGSVWEALIFAILGQQISAHVARTLRTLLVQTYGFSLNTPGATCYSFPKPETLAGAGVNGLRSIKIGRQKALYITDIASAVVTGELDLEGLKNTPDEEVISTLTGIMGVGPWTAQWLLIRGLGRPDAFPDGDLALRRTMGILIKGGSPFSPQEARKYSRRWSPYRSYVTAYLFAAVRSNRLSELASVDKRQ